MKHQDQGGHQEKILEAVPSPRSRGDYQDSQEDAFGRLFVITKILAFYYNDHLARPRPRYVAVRYFCSPSTR
jgi:hypothetical protein